MTGIAVDHVSRWYGNVVAVNDVTMALGPGVTGLLGPNGAGKSTLLHLVAGLLPPSQGSVTMGGQPVWRNERIYRTLGLVPEREALPGYLSAREFVVASARLHRLSQPEAAASRAIATVDLEDAADRRLVTYSKGMRQRAKVAAALVHEPDVLLLDEPFNGMDPRQRLHLMELVADLGAAGRTVLFSSHVLEEVEQVAGQIEVLVAGRLAASGDHRRIRRLMTDRPLRFTVRSSDDRRLAAALIADASSVSAELAPDGLHVQTVDFDRFTRLLPRLARAADIRLFELAPADESLESVFSYLVAR